MGTKAGLEGSPSPGAGGHTEQRGVKAHLQKISFSFIRFRHGTIREASTGREDVKQSKDDRKMTICWCSRNMRRGVGRDAEMYTFLSLVAPTVVHKHRNDNLWGRQPQLLSYAA